MHLVTVILVTVTVVVLGRRHNACSHALLLEELVTRTRATQTGRLLEGAGRCQRRALVDRQRRALVDHQCRTTIGTHRCTSFTVTVLGRRHTRLHSLPPDEEVTGPEAANTGHLLERAGHRQRRTLVGTHRYTSFNHLHPSVRTRCH